ncbi:MAG: HU family DNA-binding protein [Prevotella sp.]|nr:HU family DNA-binding protein [Prevotella sp.]MBQ9655701.1 HU family DNA-binding protein [Prevotella sp.]MBR1506352.1 HU family DNA-binding protein [Prevotella sp.]
MANKYALQKNTNSKSLAFGKYYARPLYDDKFVELDELAEYIQQQATVKRSDCKAVIDELGGAIEHYLGQGRKVKVNGLGIFKPGFSSNGVNDYADWNQERDLKKTRLLFTPETVKQDKKRVTQVTKKVQWEMAEVAVDSEGNELIGRKKIRERKGETPEP